MELKAELPFCPLRRSSKYATAFPRRIFRRSGGIRLFFMGSCFPSLASLWTLLTPRAVWQSGLSMMMVHKAIPDTMPFLFPEVAEDMVDFQVRALVDEMERVKEHVR